MPKRFVELARIARLLREPGGCPWDQKQTVDSMLEHFMEEAHEVKEAIEKGDRENLREELGDMVFMILMIAQITGEEGHFTISEVLEDIENKIKRRHTWVFGDDKAETAEEALALWKKNKAKEKESA